MFYPISDWIVNWCGACSGPAAKPPCTSLSSATCKCHFSPGSPSSTPELDFSEILDFFLYVQDKIKHIYFDIFDNILLTIDQRYDN